MVEHPLPGGFVNRVVRAGDTVRRGLTDHAEFVQRLLRHFEQHGWSGAPRLLGVDEHGREVLTFLEGYVAWRSPTHRVSSAESLAQVASAAAGDPAMVRLRESGAARTVHEACEWVIVHRAELETALTSP